MLEQDNHYLKIAEAISYLKNNFKEQPSLNEVAQAINLSPFYCQRIFSDWVGISPKKFMQYLSVEYAKNLLREDNLSLLDAAYETGLSGSSRLHDLFVNIEAMTPGEFKNKGAALHINFSYALTPFGRIIIASTTKGICYLSFYEDPKDALEALKMHFSSAVFVEQSDSFQLSALLIFQSDWGNDTTQRKEIKLHLKGSEFQLKVWQALLKIPMGGLSTYGRLAKAIDNPKASRAVGTAIGENPIAFLIPCHRVIKSDGKVGGYRWGELRKSGIVGWEGAKLESMERISHSK